MASTLTTPTVYLWAILVERMPHQLLVKVHVVVVRWGRYAVAGVEADGVGAVGSTMFAAARATCESAPRPPSPDWTPRPRVPFPTGTLPCPPQPFPRAPANSAVPPLDDLPSPAAATRTAQTPLDVLEVYLLLHHERVFPHVICRGKRIEETNTTYILRDVVRIMNCRDSLGDIL